MFYIVQANIETLEPESHSIITEQMKRPIFSALQQANTTAVGTTTRVEIKKSIFRYLYSKGDEG